MKIKDTLAMMEFSDRILRLIDGDAEKMARGDLQGVVEAVIMQAMRYKTEVTP